MIKVDNPYARAAEFLAKDQGMVDRYRLQQEMLPMLQIKAAAFSEGAMAQLDLCVKDLRMWAAQFKMLGKVEIAEELEGFARDWEAEGL